MAAEDAAVVVSLRANLKDYEAALKNAVRATERAAAAAEKAVSNIGKGQSLKRLTADARSAGAALSGMVKGGLAAIGIGFSASQLQAFLDANTQIQNSLKVTGLEGQKLADVYDDLKKAALANGQSFESLSQLYSRIAINQKELGLSSQQVADFVGRVAVAVRVSGASASSASAGLQQLAQALGSGKLQGDEFRSLMENIPTVMQAVARGLGVPVGALKQMSTEGKLTAQVVIDAFTKGFGDIEKRAASMAMTMGQAMENIQTSAISAAGAFDRLTSASSRVAGIFNSIAQEIDSLGKQLDLLNQFLGRGEQYAEFEAKARKAFAGVISDVESLSTDINQLGEHEGGEKLVEDFEALQDALDKGQATVSDFDKVINAATEDGSALGVALADSLKLARTAFIETTKSADGLKLGLDAIVQSAGAAAKAIAEIAVEMQKASNIAAGFPQLTNVPGLTAGPGIYAPGATRTAAGMVERTDIDLIISRAVNQKIRSRVDQFDKDFAAALAKLLRILPEARIGQGVRTYEEQYDIYYRQKIRPAAKPGTSLHEFGKAVDITGVSPEALKAAIDQIAELETLKGKTYERDKMHVQLAGASGKADQQAADAAERQAEQQATALEQLNEMIVTEERDIALKEQINTINADLSLTEDQRALAIARVTAEAAKEAEVEKLVNQAREAGLAITPALIAQYEALAQAKVNAILTDKQLAITQRETAKAAADQAEATKQLAQQIASMAQSAIGGLINDLRNGVDAGEAFNNMLNRIIDSLIQMALQSIFSPAGGGGIFGALFGGVGAAAKGGIVGRTAFPRRIVDPRVFTNAPHFAGGGLVGSEVPIIAHRGEMIIPKSMVGKGGTQSVTNNLGNVNIDMSGTGLVAAGTEQARDFGLQVQRIIQVQMVKESRPGGLLRRVPG